MTLPSRRKLSSWLILAGMVLASAGFLWLGIWQLQRLQWKLALIERVESRIHATPVAAPGSADWASLSTDAAEYLRVTIRGNYLVDQQVLVHGATALGTGYWVLTPLRTTQGELIFINRGFVTMQNATAVVPAAAEPQTVTGLLRMTEPNGNALRRNQPDAANWQSRWYSRDIAALTAFLKLDTAHTAPYFIDAEATEVPVAADPHVPRPGLTVVSFRNNHLSYALTWFALALLPWLLLWITIRRSRASRPDA